MSRNTKNKWPSPVSTCLKTVSSDFGWEKQLRLHKVFPNWSKIVPKEVSEHSKPLKIVQGVLWVEVENSSWIQQFQYQKYMLLEDLNDFLIGDSLKDVRFVQKSPEEEKKAEVKISFVPPSPKEIAEFEDLAGIVDDQKSREALISYWYLSKSCKVSKL